MSEKTQEQLDFESMDWQYVAFHRVDNTPEKFVNQQGSKAYMDDIVQNMKTKLGEDHSVTEAIEEALKTNNNLTIEYHLVKQAVEGTDVLTNGLKVKKFNIE